MSTTLLALGTALAQQREPVRGAVNLADGTPWAGATVTLLWRPVADDPQFGEPEQVVAVSDAKGRFQAALVAGRRYVAWATADLPDGRYRASHPVEDVCAGRPLELIADAPRAPATVQVEGLDAWRPHGPIHCTLLSRTRPRLQVDCTEQAGRLVLRAFPGRRAALEVRCGERVLLAWAAAVDLTDTEVQRVGVQPPRAARFRCVDRQRQPVAGVAFLACDLQAEHATAIAHSDADGMLTPLLPLPAKRFDWGNYPMLLLGDGLAPRSWIGTLRIPADHDAATSKPLLEFLLDSGRHLQSRLRLGEAPATGAALRLVGGMSCADPGGGGTHEVARRVPLAADGRFAADVDPTQGAVLTAILPDALLVKLQPERGFPLHPEVLLAALAPDDANAGLPEQVDLAQLAALDVQVLGEGGTPADTAMVGITARLPQHERALVASTDRTGHVRLLLPRHHTLTLCAWSAHGFAHAEIDTDQIQGQLRPQLQPCRQLEGTVVRGEQAVAWAEVSIFVGNDSLEPAGALAACLGNHLRLRTDARGRFAMTLYPDLRCSVSQVATPDDDHYPTVREFTVGKDEPESLTIDVAAPR